MHKILAFSLVSLGLSACDHPTDDSPSKIVNMKDTQKKHRQVNTYIYEYNDIIYNLNTEQDQITAHLKLKNLLKKIPSNDNNLNFLKTKRKILVHLGCLNEAYIVTEKILAKTDSSNLQEIQCIFLSKMKKDAHEVKACYEKTANSYLNEINLIPKAALRYQYALWGHYAAMFHAGHIEYKDKLQEIINYHNIEDHKKTYQQMYENVMNPSIFQKRLDSIPYTSYCY
ncbi:hypothetical protein [Acinetobacter sp. WU_MDCI_Abxb74]|uniref:hypothetical protein n=1 Tax=Acinetobacter sp. WU_MDCI_Abxb74 TaxID=2850072 RepID=UPI0021CD8B40|nr:hypothetical protein [Acinetobacter sp. WU_MDCI_Abxb74]MCU4423517.1 hypothetical protein [Acinetobacter sp. WU_MDCI_Abxb74]